MKILLITMDTHGGLLHYTSQLANEFSKKYQVTVITPLKSNKELFVESVKILMLPLGNTKMNIIKNVLISNNFYRCVKAINNEKPDIIHFQSTYIWICLLLPFIRKYKIVTTIHDVSPQQGVSLIPKTFDHFIARNILIAYSHCLIVQCQKEKEKLLKLTNTNKCYVIPHGDYSFFEKLHSKIGDKSLSNNPRISNQNTILFFGNILKYKGLEYLIKAEPLISKKIPKLNIIIAGQGNLNMYSKFIKNQNNFEIYNHFIPNEKIDALFRRAKIIVMPYISCSSSGVIAISCAYKIPAVASKVGCMPEVIEHYRTGILVPPKDIHALADAIIELLKNDELRKQMGENAYRKMKDDLSWNKIADKTIEVYNEVLNVKESA